MIKLNLTQIRYNYIESSQYNPIRYQLMTTTDGVTFSNTTGLFRCRDYFNDFAVFLNIGQEFTVYGMASSAVVPDASGGVYVLMHNCTPTFLNNVEASVNTEIKSSYGFMLSLQQVDKDKVLVYIPKGGWSSTFRISFLTLMLRNCNVSRTIENYDDLIDDDFYADGHLDDIRYQMFKQRQYMFPSESKYLWYASSKYNSLGEWAGGMTVHDAGIMVYTYQLIDEIMARLDKRKVKDKEPNSDYDPEQMVDEEDYNEDDDWEGYYDEEESEGV